MEYYKKLTPEIVEEAIAQAIENSSKEPQYVVHIFGTVEQVTEEIKKFNKAISDELREKIRTK